MHRKAGNMKWELESSNDKLERLRALRIVLGRMRTLDFAKRIRMEQTYTVRFCQESTKDGRTRTYAICEEIDETESVKHETD